MSRAIPLCVPFPPRPLEPVADIGQGYARRVLYHVGLNCKKSLKDRDYPTFHNSKYVCACVFVYGKQGRCEKYYGKTGKFVLSTELRCRLPSSASTFFQFLHYLNVNSPGCSLFSSEEVNVATSFACAVQVIYVLCCTLPYQHILQNDNSWCKVLA